METVLIIKLICLWVLFGFWGTTIEIKHFKKKTKEFYYTIFDGSYLFLSIFGGGLTFLLIAIHRLVIDKLCELKPNINFDRRKIIDWFFQEIYWDDVEMYFCMALLICCFLVGIYEIFHFLIIEIIKYIK